MAGTDEYDRLLALGRVIDFFRTRSVFWAFPDDRLKNKREELSAGLVGEACALLSIAGFPGEEFRGDVETWLADRVNGREADRATDDWLPPSISDLHNSIRAMVERVPSSRAKAEALLLAEYKHQPSPIVVAYVDGCIDRSIAAPLRNDAAVARLFGGSPSSDEIDWLERYRFLITEGRRIDRAEVEELGSDFHREFSEFSSGLDGLDPNVHLLPGPMRKLVFFWLCSREPDLRAAVFGVGRKLAHELLRWQKPGGYHWLHRREGAAQALVETPSPLLTALALNLALVFGDPDVVEAQLARGIGWLTAQQHREGWWEWLRGDGTPDFLTAVSTIELMKGFSAAENVAAITSAETWVIGAQHPIGGWSVRGYADSFLLVLAIEALDARRISPHGLQRQLRLSREMLFKAEELLRHGETVDLQLSVIAAHHACEVFLYGYFSSLEPEEPYVGQDGRTLGLTASLSRLQERLVADGRLDRGRGLPHRTQVQQLSTARDGIVHRANAVSAPDANGHVSAARRFISFHSVELLGGSIL